MATLRNKIVLIMLLAGLAPAVVAYFSRALLEAVTGKIVLDGFFHLFTVSLMVLVSAVFAGIISKKVLEKAQQIRDADDEMEIEELLAQARKKAEISAPAKQSAELARVSKQLDGLEEGAPLGVLMMRHTDGRVVSANRNFRKLFALDNDDLSYSRLKVKLFTALEDNELFKALWTTRGECQDPEKEWCVVSGKTKSWVKITTKQVSKGCDDEVTVWFFQDVTDALNLRSALHRSQRMESIGRLAGGVAHDFNNMLTGIIGNLSLAELSGKGEIMAVTDLELIASARKAGQRAADLVKRLLDYSRDGAEKVQAVDINELIGDTHDLLHNSFDDNIEFSVNLGEELWSVNADVTQLQQVLLNLCMNARDALVGGGRIRMESSNVVIDGDESRMAGPPEGSFVCMTVEDTGMGIPPEMISKIFDPYFTTKKPGEDSGTGIGLAVTSEIVQKFKGRITCESTVGKGTTFRVYLPKSAVEGAESEPKSVGRSTSVSRTDSHDGTETVLLVDDEEMVRKVGAGILKKKGYHVILAEDGDEAVRIFDEKKDQIHIVLLDLTMPKLSGRAAFEMIKERSLSVPVLLCSGYPVDIDDFEEETGYRPEGAVQKPFSVESLCGQIRHVLDAHYGLVLSASE